ncbi:hypothetical protein CHS0354_001892 [Potamilus streckersoni]|uniref:Uncharacterized protein n=1 Tax=Potamilus streckersoni TaxID=2493646 RepID=A0AAE0W3Y4_9BIVA|nr:hypothetical protein CHS0354_001892 [Potamilus streckersoni]
MGILSCYPAGHDKTFSMGILSCCPAGHDKTFSMGHGILSFYPAGHDKTFSMGILSCYPAGHDKTFSMGILSCYQQVMIRLSAWAYCHCHATRQVMIRLSAWAYCHALSMDTLLFYPAGHEKNLSMGILSCQTATLNHALVMGILSY